MKVILIMPPKFLAGFLNRVITRRHPFSQAIAHSTMLRRHHASQPNTTVRADRFSFSCDGITASISSSNRNASIHSTRLLKHAFTFSCETK